MSINIPATIDNRDGRHRAANGDAVERTHEKAHHCAANILYERTFGDGNASAFHRKLERLLQARKKRALARFNRPRQQFAGMTANGTEIEDLASGASQMMDTRIAKHALAMSAPLHRWNERMIQTRLGTVGQRGLGLDLRLFPCRD